MATQRKCLFCGNTDLSKEHIFAQWLLKELSIMDNTVKMTHAGFVGEISNRQHPFSKLVNGLVCKRCNNGWMSDLEGQCQQHIINLMNMDNVEEEISFLNDNHEVVATIDIAYAETEPSLEWRQSQDGLIVRDQRIPMKMGVNRYTITFQIKRLMVKVAFYETDENVFYEDEDCIRIFPEYGLYGKFKVYKNIDDFDVHGVMREYISEDK